MKPSHYFRFHQALLRLQLMNATAPSGQRYTYALSSRAVSVLWVHADHQHLYTFHATHSWTAHEQACMFYRLVCWYPFVCHPEPRILPRWAEVLGLTRLPHTLAEIQHAFRFQAHHHHPDAGGSAERFRELVAARDSAHEWIHTHALSS